MEKLLTRHINLKVSTIFIVNWLVAPYAYAYIDPGTGSYLLQIMFGLIMGIIVIPQDILRKLAFWRKRKHLQIPEDSAKSNEKDSQ